MEQRSDEWFQARLGRATGSGFAKVMARGRGGAEAVTRKDYRYQLIAERLTGRREETYKSIEMQWGIEWEDTARLRYSLISGNTVEECGFFTHPTIMAGASPDGLIGEVGLLEIKCPKTSTHVETLRKQRLPSQYFWQVMGQLWITDRQWCDFVSFDPRMPKEAQIFVTRIERDEEYINQLREGVADFLNEVDQEEQFIRTYKGKDGQVAVNRVSV